MKNTGSICSDSRKAGPGDIFVATHSGAEGMRHALAAVSAGASQIVAEFGPPPEISGVKWTVTANAGQALGLMASAQYGWPSRKLDVYAVTGTNGKTTVVQILRHILSKNGVPTGLISTIGNRVFPSSVKNTSDAEKLLPTRNTTPGPLELQRLFSEMAANGCMAAAMEMSSHALTQYRAAGTKFKCVGFTNLTRDHLDYHNTMEKYYLAKRSLFVPLRCRAAINIDSEWGRRLRDDIFAAAAGQPDIITFGESQDADVRFEDVELSPSSSCFTLLFEGKRRRVETRLPGAYNIYNALTAFSMSLAGGITPENAARALSSAPPVKGRLQKTVCPASPASFFVDYAHTPDALKNVLETLRKVTAGRLIVVFGAGGDRDKTKRPIMGQTAYEKADILIVTSDNPRSEDPDSIIADILNGIPEAAVTHSGARSGTPKIMAITDRREAIRTAAKLADKPEDVVVVAGKGHETYQIFSDRTEKFDDAEEIAACGRG